MSGDSSRAVWLRQARSYLRDADPVLARLIAEMAALSQPRDQLSVLRRLRAPGAAAEITTTKGEAR